MKKLVIFLVVILLAFAGFLTWKSYQPETHMALTNEEAPAYSGEMSAEAADAHVHHLDYEAMAALYPEDEVVMSMLGQDLTWGEYFAWFKMNAAQVEAFFEQMAMYYGIAADWSGSTGDGVGTIYADLPALSTEETLLRFAAIEKLAADKGVNLSDESLAQLEDQAMAEAIIGEGATVEELVEALEQMGLDLASYKRISAVNLLYSEILANDYGADYELVNNDDVALWLSDLGYISANHILFITTNKDTGEVVDEATKAKKKAQAEELYAELCAIANVEERTARFLELKEQYCEDGSKAYYPNGYTYTSGTMVSEFENAVNAQEAYEISEPVESSYGYHIIMRMPLGNDSIISDSSGNKSPASWIYAQQLLNAEVEALMTEDAITYAEEFTDPNVLDFIKE